MPRRSRATVSLPRGVHRVVARGREYFYWSPGRGTAGASERIRLPNDPHSAEFWTALRQAQGLAADADAGTFGAVADEFLTFFKGLVEQKKKAPGTLDQYARALRRAKTYWGSLSAKGLRPPHVHAAMDKLMPTPGAANNLLSAMKSLSDWGITRDKFDQSPVQGVKPYPTGEGHKEWTDEQIAAVHAKLTGVVRRGIIFYLYTGMRGSDAVRMGWNDVKRGGFAYTNQKKKRDVFCPIVDELKAEMDTWEKRPGPFLLREQGRAKGRAFSRNKFSELFAKAREQVPELEGTTLHGLRATAVIRLRREGLEAPQIGDIVGMSIAMVERYCRTANKEKSAKAALLVLNRTRTEQQL